ncbi:MAG: prevent-host-death protein [Gammaproteobacteria bacterium]|nr:prevent-host-death protein [Gammaproteobacteria bacterium]NNJ83472.1 prevent-host-death protein [Gammaproteobacteria bacterium]
MKMYTYSEARQHLSAVLNTAEHEEVLIRRQDGRSFSITPKNIKPSPFDVPGIKTKVTTAEILDTIAEGRRSRVEV